MIFNDAVSNTEDIFCR